jgi:hypothetical protein
VVGLGTQDGGQAAARRAFAEAGLRVARVGWKGLRIRRERPGRSAEPARGHHRAQGLHREHRDRRRRRSHHRSCRDAGAMPSWSAAANGTTSFLLVLRTSASAQSIVVGLGTGKQTGRGELVILTLVVPDPPPTRAHPGRSADRDSPNAQPLVRAADALIKAKPGAFPLAFSEIGVVFGKTLPDVATRLPAGPRDLRGASRCRHRDRTGNMDSRKPTGFLGRLLRRDLLPRRAVTSPSGADAAIERPAVAGPLTSCSIARRMRAFRSRFSPVR